MEQQYTGQNKRRRRIPHTSNRHCTPCSNTCHRVAVGMPALTCIGISACMKHEAASGGQALGPQSAQSHDASHPVHFRHLTAPHAACITICTLHLLSQHSITPGKPRMFLQHELCIARWIHLYMTQSKAMHQLLIHSCDDCSADGVT
jgi:hypothetical protein